MRNVRIQPEPFAPISNRQGSNAIPLPRWIFPDTLGGDDRSHENPSGERVLVAQGLLEHMTEKASWCDGT